MLVSFCYAQRIHNELHMDGEVFVYSMEFVDSDGQITRAKYRITFPEYAREVKFSEDVSYSNRMRRTTKDWTISAYVPNDGLWYFVVYHLSSDACGETPELYCLGKLVKESFGENVYEIDLENSGFRTLFNVEEAVKYYDEKVEMYQIGEIPIGSYVPQKLDMSSLDLNGSYLLPEDESRPDRILVNKIQRLLVRLVG